MKQPAKTDIAVLLLFFNRADTFRQVFEAVKEARPSKLFLYQDGPRGERDMAGIEACRAIVSDENIDWECEVHRMYQEKNYGCDPSEYISQKWAFSIVDKCMVLEDDDVPSQSFFPFCKEMLDKYENDERISMISGFNTAETSNWFIGVLDLGTMKKGEVKRSELEYTNPTTSEHSVALATSALNSQYFASQVSLPNIKANEIGQFIFQLNSADTKLYGPVEIFAYVVIDGKKELDDAHKLLIKANIEEDFDAMTVEQKQLAPIIENDAEVNAGKIAADKSHKIIIPVKNAGVNPLEIRRAYSTDKALTIKTPKAIKSGKKGDITVNINTKGLERGNYSREVVIISNDYKQSVKRVKLNFVVE